MVSADGKLALIVCSGGASPGMRVLSLAKLFGPNAITAVILECGVRAFHIECAEIVQRPAQPAGIQKPVC
jgi:hypothetical protein